MLMNIAQAVILICGIGAVLLVNNPNKNVSKYACFFGLACQPAWAYSTYTHGEWGTFLLTFVYTYGWSVGLYHNWIKNHKVQALDRGTSSDEHESAGQ